jgi:hypothetical protein
MGNAEEVFKQKIDDDYAEARRQRMMIVGFPRTCQCGGSAYHSPKANWQNRVVCLACGKKWSE